MRLLLGARAFAQSKGLETELLGAVDLQEALFEDLEAWVPMSTFRAMFDFLERRDGDAAVGLRCADCVPPVAFDFLRFIAETGADVGAAFGVLVDFSPLLVTESRVTLYRGGGHARLSLAAAERQLLGARAAEYVMGCALRAFQSVSARPLRPRSVEFTHPPPPDAASFARFFGCPTSFGQADDALIFDEQVLALPAARPDVHLRRVLLRYADAVSARAPAAERMVDRVERWVLQRLGKGPLSIQTAAKSLGVSRRTLQRRLEAEGAQFRALVDGARERLARSYLSSNSLAVGEVASLLGYNDVRAFHRAFVGWTGETPGHFRKAATRGRGPDAGGPPAA